jgi:hypothetical protein
MSIERESVHRAFRKQKERTFEAIIAEITQVIEMCIKAKMLLAGQMLMCAGTYIMTNFERLRGVGRGLS